MDTTVNARTRRLTTQTEDELTLALHFPSTGPLLDPTMSVIEMYHDGAEHHNHNHDCTHTVRQAICHPRGMGRAVSEGGGTETGACTGTAGTEGVLPRLARPQANRSGRPT